jgi:putative addiction module component (TIGR02574 family)
MTRPAEDILKEALELPEVDRDLIADSLWRSIDRPAESVLSEEWSAEIERRIAEIDSGKVKLVPGEEVLAQLRAKYVR